MVQVEEFDNQRQLIYEKLLSPEGRFETRYKYDENGNSILEENYSNGEKTDHSIFKYDEGGFIIMSHFFINDELYKSTEVNTTESGSITTTYIEGVEVLKIVNETKGDHSTSIEYEQGEIVKKVTSYESKQVLKETIHNGEGAILYYKNSYFDEEGRLLKNECLSLNLNIISEEIYTYKNKLLIHFSYRNFDENLHHFLNHDYDNQGNMLKKEVRDEQNQLLEFELFEYDSNNRLIKKVIIEEGKSSELVIQHEEIN